MNAPHPTWPVATTPAANFIANRWVASAAGATLPMIERDSRHSFARRVGLSALGAANPQQKAHLQTELEWATFDRELLAGFFNHAHLGIQL